MVVIIDKNIHYQYENLLHRLFINRIVISCSVAKRKLKIRNFMEVYEGD